jgi:hypothetical protein
MNINDEKQKLIFSPEWTDEKLYSQLKKVVNKSVQHYRKNNYTKKDYYSEQPRHKFVLPPSFRSGQINFNNIKKWFVDNNWGNLIRNEIFLGPFAVKEAIEFLFEDQDDDNYRIDKKTGFREESVWCCDTCDKETKELIKNGTPIYGCCDLVYPIEKSWFDVHHSYCENCRSFFLDGEEELIDTILFEVLPKELVLIVKLYLPRSLLTMQEASVISCKDGEIQNKKMFIKPIISSMLTEWLPFFKHDEDYDGLVIFLVNCNPDSKFYSTIFSYQHEGWNNKIIQL